MPLDISFRPIRVLIDGHDSEGNLILADGDLAAVIVRLDGEHKGLWHPGGGVRPLRYPYCSIGVHDARGGGSLGSKNPDAQDRVIPSSPSLRPTLNCSQGA
jgi:hypothetical protein